MWLSGARVCVCAPLPQNATTCVGKRMVATKKRRFGSHPTARIKSRCSPPHGQQPHTNTGTQKHTPHGVRICCYGMCWEVCSTLPRHARPLAHWDLPTEPPTCPLPRSAASSWWSTTSRQAVAAECGCWPGWCALCRPLLIPPQTTRGRIGLRAQQPQGCCANSRHLLGSGCALQYIRSHNQRHMDAFD